MNILQLFKSKNISSTSLRRSLKFSQPLNYSFPFHSIWLIKNLEKIWNFLQYQKRIFWFWRSSNMSDSEARKPFLGPAWERKLSIYFNKENEFGFSEFKELFCLLIKLYFLKIRTQHEIVTLLSPIVRKERRNSWKKNREKKKNLRKIFLRQDADDKKFSHIIFFLEKLNFENVWFDNSSAEVSWMSSKKIVESFFFCKNFLRT